MSRGWTRGARGFALGAPALLRFGLGADEVDLERVAGAREGEQERLPPALGESIERLERWDVGREVVAHLGVLRPLPRKLRSSIARRPR